MGVEALDGMSDLLEGVDGTLVEGRAPDLEVPREMCVLEGPGEPCVLVIFGASGDLAGRKLLPALWNLYLQGGVPQAFAILGCARTPMTDETFRAYTRELLESAGMLKESRWEGFSRLLHYRVLDYGDPAGFKTLGSDLDALDREARTAGNRVFYLAVPPGIYARTAELLGSSGLSGEEKNGGGWSRIVVEKPFGHDLESAERLDEILHRYFREHQIFRIDHYLAKETVQNILMFRFANAIFEPLWNRRYIDYVAVTAAETLGIEHRADYYEGAGVLRDMFQNHMMQLLALTAMEPPSIFEAERVRDEKAKVYRALRPFPVDRLDEYLVLGQYGPGVLDGREVPGYREETRVSPDSLTPTFAMIRVFLDNWRWQGVPFYLTSGKRLQAKRTEIAIAFKQVPHSMFRQVLGEHISANRLVLGIYPEERITLTFQTKNPGAKVCLRTVTMDFNYHQNYTGPVLEAYEKVLIDCILGDQMLFWRQDGVELCWSFLTPILHRCETCGNRAERLLRYPAGSWGPDQAHQLGPVLASLADGL